MAKRKAQAKTPSKATVDDQQSFRDRITEFIRVPATELKPNPRNWRTHPEEQQAAVRGILSEVGYADALLARRLEDGSLELIDGHLRLDVSSDCKLPVLVVDVTAEEADKLLAAFDPLAAMAGADAGKLEALLRDVQTGDQALAKMLTDLAEQHGIVEAEDDGEAGGGAADVELTPSFQVIVECGNEDTQREIFERMTKEGFECRALTL